MFGLFKVVFGDWIGLVGVFWVERSFWVGVIFLFYGFLINRVFWF